MEEERQVMALCEDFNPKLCCDGVEAQNEVVVVGGVELSQDEMSLLNLGPGFMVTKPLDVDEMEVEAVVTLMKIRWGRRTKGFEDMDDKEISDYEKDNPVDEEEESLN